MDTMQSVHFQIIKLSFDKLLLWQDCSETEATFHFDGEFLLNGENTSSLASRA